jgi:hypothetical protein
MANLEEIQEKLSEVGTELNELITQNATNLISSLELILTVAPLAKEDANKVKKLIKMIQDTVLD